MLSRFGCAVWKRKVAKVVKEQQQQQLSRGRSDLNFNRMEPIP